MDSVENLCKRYNLIPRTLLEVGASHPRNYRLDYFVKNGFNVILVEANPRLHFCLTKGSNNGDFRDVWPNVPPPPYQHSGLDGFKNCQILNIAISDRNETLKLFERDASTFISGLNSPAKVNDHFQESESAPYYLVESKTIDKIDNGEIDVLLNDTEGCEYFSLTNFVSRPKIIVLETHGYSYTNPYIKEISQWMKENNYSEIERDFADTLYVRNY